MESIYDINDSVKVLNTNHKKFNKSGTVIKTWAGAIPCCLVLIENEEHILDDEHLILE